MGTRLFVGLLLLVAMTLPVGAAEIDSMRSGAVFRDRLADGAQGPEMVVIAAGTFRMGDIQGEGRKNEKPVHEVRITRSFAIGKYEVTVGQFADFVKATGYKTEAEQGDGCWGWSVQWKSEQWKKNARFNWRSPGFSQNDDHPVVCVSWHDAKAYIDWLSRQAGHAYRLPTEAEWEYAAQAGSTAAYSFGNDAEAVGNYAWYLNNSSKKTHPVGQKQPNAWGLYDVHGNASEWVGDWYDAGYYAKSPLQDPKGPATSPGRVIRGGGGDGGARSCRSAHRYVYVPSDRLGNVGFRLVRL